MRAAYDVDETPLPGWDNGGMPPSALPDGTLAGARPGSGNFSFRITGRAAHAGRQ